MWFCCENGIEGTSPSRGDVEVAGIECQDWRLATSNPLTKGEVMKQRTTVGIDLAKEVFAVCMLSPQGAVVEARTMRRAAFERWVDGLQGELVDCNG